MDNINGLPDDLLVKILSFVPTKVAVSTCVLSKRWEFLWMWLPRLEFITEYVNSHYPKPRLGDFFDKKLPLHKAPIIESLLLQLRSSSHIKRGSIRRLIDLAVSCYIRELEIDYFLPFENSNPLFTCKSLVILKLKYGVIGVVSSTVFLPSLKTLQLEHVQFVDEKSLQQLLSGCPVLEDLSVYYDDNSLKEFTIIVPSLQSLTLCIPDDFDWILDGYEIDTPSLKYLKLEDWNCKEHYSLIIKNMPKLREAYVDVFSSDTKILIIGPIKSVKRLTICCLEDLYGDGCVFKELEHLNICVCVDDSWKLLDKLLKGSPKLRVLDISVMKDHRYDNDMVCWNQPSHVPECLLSSLQIFKWSQYFGRPQDRDIAIYILKNACHLKKATILTNTRFVPKLEMIKELTLSPPASSTCQLVFAEDLDHIET